MLVSLVSSKKLILIKLVQMQAQLIVQFWKDYMKTVLSKRNIILQVVIVR